MKSYLFVLFFVFILSTNIFSNTDPKVSDTLKVRDGEITFFPVSHSSMAIIYRKIKILIDPVGEIKQYKKFKFPNLILITDIHGDHLAPELISKIAKKKKTIIMGPKAATDKLKDIMVISNNETKEIPGVSIEAIPMYNISEERKKFHVKGRGNGYVLTIGEKRIYISGDTEDIPEMRALKNIDAAFICMNLPYTMTEEQAASAVLEFKPAIVYPYHYRGKGGMSDINLFKDLVQKESNIEVKFLKWY